MSAEHSEEGASRPELLDELFPLEPPANRTRRGGRAVEPGRVTEVLHARSAARRVWPASGLSSRGGPSLEGERSAWWSAAIIGAVSALGGLAVRLVVVRAFASRLGHLGRVAFVHLGESELAVGAAVVALIAGLYARRGLPILVCVAVALALSTIDLAAPVGIALVAAAVLVTRRRRD